MLPVVFLGISVLIILAELYTGIAVGAVGPDAIVHRSEHPGPYWILMVIHFLGAIVLPWLSWLIV
jgi:hypothetical protein